MQRTRRVAYGCIKGGKLRALKASEIRRDAKSGPEDNVVARYERGRKV